MPLSGWPRWARVTVLALVVVFFAAATVFLGHLRDTTHAAKFDLTAADVSATAPNPNARTFVVNAAPLSQVDLFVNGHRVATEYVPWDAATARFDNAPLDDGLNTVKARATLWYAPDDPHDTTDLVVDNSSAKAKALAFTAIDAGSGGEPLVAGKGPPLSDLVLWEATRPLKSDKTAPFGAFTIADRLRTSADGTFTTRVALAEGVHRFWLATPNCRADQACFKQGPNDSVVARSGPAPGPFLNARSLFVHVRYQQIQAAFAVSLSRTDPTAAALLHGRIDLPPFVDDVFGSSKLNGKPLSSFFTNARPRVYVNEDAVTISGDSGFQRPGLESIPPLTGQLVVENAFSAHDIPAAALTNVLPGTILADRLWSSDVLRLAVEDYRIVDPEPVPFRTEGSTVVWDRPLAEGVRPVTVSIAYSPFTSLAAFRHGLVLTFAGSQHPIGRFLALAHGLILGIPMLAYLVLSRGRHARFARVARILLVLVVAPDVFNACIWSQPDLNGSIIAFMPALQALKTSLLRDLVAPVFVGLLFGGVFSAVARLLRARGGAAAVTAYEAATAIGFAAFAYAVLAVLGYTIGAFVHVPALYPILIDLTFAAVLIAILDSLQWWQIGSGAYRLPFAVGTVLLAIVIAFPFSLVHYGLWASSPAQAATAFADPGAPFPLATEFLRGFAVICPFAFGLLLIALAKPGSGAVGLDDPQFARIALCCYAVDPTGVVLVIPLSFILAWSTFHWISREPPAGAADVITRRAVLIGDVLTRPNVDHLGDKIAGFADDLIDAKITAADYAAKHTAALAVLDHVGDPAAADLLAVAPNPDSRANGIAAIPIAVVFALIQVLLFLPVEIAHLRELHSPFVLLDVVAFVAVAAGACVIPAYAFGAAYERIRGSTGVHKAVNVAIWAVACSLPAWFLRLDNPASIVVTAVQIAVFYTALGLFFDLAIIRGAMRSRFRLRDVPRLSGVSGISWAGGVAVAAFGVALNGVLTGQFQNGLTQVVTSFVRQFAGEP
jgi:hypothetical protein